MTTAQLCVSASCNLPGHHTEDCEGGDCRGCAPARAADGLYLCRLCTRRLSHDAFNAAYRFEALGMALTGGGGGGESGFSSGEDAGVELDAAAVEFRSAIRSTLVSICRLIAEERGITLPRDTVDDMARYVHRHAAWLAAHQAADEHAQDLRDIGTDPVAYRVAFPSRSDRVYIGTCPLGVDLCGARLYQRSEEGTITCPACGESGSLEWWQWEMFGDLGAVVDAYAASGHLANRWRRPVDAALIRKWGQRYPDAGLITEEIPNPDDPEHPTYRPIRDRKGRALYHLSGLLLIAERLWGASVIDPANPSTYPSGVTRTIGA